MDDLSTLEWSNKPVTVGNPRSYGVPLPALRPTPPISGLPSTLSKSSSSSPSNVKIPAKDSFSNLIPFNAAAPANKSLSLQERQKKLLEQRTQQQEAKQQEAKQQEAKQQEAKQQSSPYTYSRRDEEFWDRLGSDGTTPPPAFSSVVSGSQPLTDPPVPNQNGTVETEDDILSAFRADAPVDSSSHFPKPNQTLLAANDARQLTSSAVTTLGSTGDGLQSQRLCTFDDDDPFGMAERTGEQPGRNREPSCQNDVQNDDEDVLGLLGKPVSELPKPQKMVPSLPAPTMPTATNARVEAMAGLVEMGFPQDRAREALDTTESGTDIQQAVGWLLNKAHSKSAQKSQPWRRRDDGPGQDQDPEKNKISGSRPQDSQSHAFEEPCLGNQHLDRTRRQRRTAPPTKLEKDSVQVASELGATFLKTAGSLWTTSAKKVQQAVNEFHSDTDSSQPKWMMEAGIPPRSQGSDHDVRTAAARSGHRNLRNGTLGPVTDEAILLETDRAPPPARKLARRQQPAHEPSAEISRDHSPPMHARLSQQYSVPSVSLRPQDTQKKAALNRQAIDVQASEAYVSSARRRAPKPSPLNTPPLEPMYATQPAFPQHPQVIPSSQPSGLDVRRSAAAPRSAPPVSPTSLKASHADRAAGNAHVKRGDYSAAYESYTSSLKHLPANHPLTIMLLTNRALTALKSGKPKVALSDTETAIAVIGHSRGEAESIDPMNGDPPEPMRDYFGRAVLRKAEALEQMEKWREAAVVWREAVEGGHGGDTSFDGRRRCEKAAGLQQPERVKTTPPKKLATAAPIRSTISTKREPSTTAVQRLRAANTAAEKVDDEKFALADAVDAKVAAWKSSKAENLRALLASLEMVLWPEARWKNVTMAELILPAKVKVHYMKGIGKVHPDKLPTAATTEQRMIAGSVFTTLNKAWDKFKAENGL